MVQRASLSQMYRTRCVRHSSNDSLIRVKAGEVGAWHHHLGLVIHANATSLAPTISRR